MTNGISESGVNKSKLYEIRGTILLECDFVNNLDNIIVEISKDLFSQDESLLRPTMINIQKGQQYAIQMQI